MAAGMLESPSRTVFAVFALMALYSSPAAADVDPSPIRVVLHNSDDTISGSVDVTRAFTEAFRSRLGNGLTSRIVLQMTLLDPKERVVARTTRTCSFQFDIWDEFLEVRIRDGDLDRRPISRRVIDRGLVDCGRIDRIRLAHRSLLSWRSGYRLMVLVQLNPVSEEQIQRAREFMANPRSSSRGRPRTFFGAVAAMFRSKPQYYDDEILFRSQPLAPPRRPK